jgi:hypothetical protein
VTGGAGRRALGRLVAACVGAGTFALARRALDSRAPGGPAAWARTNHAGREVSLLGGLALGASLGLAAPLAARAGSRPVPTSGTVRTSPASVRGHRRDVARSRLPLAAGLAATAATVAGAIDDHSERFTGLPSAQAKGLRGHLGALARGEVTTGAMKIAIIGAGSLAASATLGGGRGVVRVLADTALVAGCANLANLFDLRPGRALKVGGATLLPAALGLGSRSALPGRSALAAAGLGAVVAALPADLRAEDMLGDTGANPLGAACGVVLASGGSAPGRALALAGVVGLTLLSERVSFSAVIDSVPVLSAVDRAGRA